MLQVAAKLSFKSPQSLEKSWEFEGKSHPKPQGNKALQRDYLDNHRHSLTRPSGGLVSWGVGMG